MLPVVKRWAPSTYNTGPCSTLRSRTATGASKANCTIMRGAPIPKHISVITKAQSHEVIGMIEEFIQSSWMPPLIVLDTLGRVKPPRSPGADSYQVDYAIASQLKTAIDTCPGATLLVVHHSRKAESPDFVDAVSGTAGLAGAADFVIVLSRKRHSQDAQLSVTGRDVNEAEYALRSDNGLWYLDGDSLQSAAQAVDPPRSKPSRRSPASMPPSS